MANIDLITEKYDELRAYVGSLCKRWQADVSRYDDVFQSTITRLIEEAKIDKFTDNKSMWGRCTNVAREEIAKTFAERLPLSGVGFQAHWTATKALQKAQGDPTRAYAEQTGTSRVSRELLYVVSKGASLYSPGYLSEVDAYAIHDRESSLSVQDEDNIRVALSDLSELEANVLRLKFWQNMTYIQIAKELDKTPKQAREAYKRAIQKLRPILKRSMERFM